MPSNAIRIAKNTLMLYVRQIVIMLVNLYTLRVVLVTLGVEDFGIYNVAGGIVVLFTFLNGAMTGTTQRFLNFALGQNDTEQVRNVYSASLVIHAAIAVVLIVLAQTVGLWFFHTWLNIPSERHVAAFAVYQFSLMTAVIGILQVPYRATIIAYERMSFFAVLSIIEAVLRLGVVFILPVIMFDRLTIYAFLISITAIIILFIYKIYCNKTFETARFRYCKERQLFRQLLGFSGWSAFGSFSTMGRDQGVNILINIFHGVSLNAALGIAMQVNAAIYQFVRNFQTAFNPQITKSYAAKNYDYLMRLILSTAKLSFFLMFFFVLPLYINADFVLRIWLVNVPEYAVTFTQLMLVSSLPIVITGPLWMAIQATGDVKNYQLIASCFLFANLPLSLLFLWLGFDPMWILTTRIILTVLFLFWLIFFVNGRIKLSIKDFFCEVIIPIFIVAGGASFVTVLSHGLFVGDWARLIASCVVSTVSIGCLIYWIGLNKKERVLFRNYVAKESHKNRMLK